jgi:hypothetical protein
LFGEEANDEDENGDDEEEEDGKNIFNDRYL